MLIGDVIMVKKDFSVLSPKLSFQGFDWLVYIIGKDKEALAIISFLLSMIISDSAVVSTVSAGLVSALYSLLKFYIKEHKKQ